MKKILTGALVSGLAVAMLNTGGASAAMNSPQKETAIERPAFSVHTSAATRQASTYQTEKEPNNTYKRANSLVMEQWGLGVFGTANDVDYYKIKVQYYGYMYALGTTQSKKSVDYSVYNAKNKAIKMQSYYSNEGIDFKLYFVTPGTYYIKAKDTGVLGKNDPYAVGAAMTGPLIKEVGDKDSRVTGKADPGSIVYVKVKNTIVNKKGTKVGSKGTYSVKVAKQKPGTKVTVWATSIVDGQILQSQSVTTTVKDATAPNMLTVSKVKSTSKSISGKTEAKAKVQVKAGSKILGKATADSKGNYKVVIKPQKKNTKLTIIATDKAGNAKIVKTTVK